MGSVDLLSREVIIVIIVNYYLEICRSATKMYRESAGLFKNIKRMILIKGGLNIVLSFVLGKIWGLWGILIATTIASAATLFWYEPLIVFRYFKKSFMNEIYYQFITLLQMAASLLVTGLAVGALPEGGVLHFLLKAAVCGVVCNLCYLVFYFIFKQSMKKYSKP